MQTFIFGFPIRRIETPLSLSEGYLYIFLKIFGKGNLKNLTGGTVMLPRLSGLANGSAAETCCRLYPFMLAYQK
jgi:hypothetical protein